MFHTRVGIRKLAVESSSFCHSVFCFIQFVQRLWLACCTPRMNNRNVHRSERFHSNFPIIPRVTSSFGKQPLSKITRDQRKVRRFNSQRIDKSVKSRLNKFHYYRPSFATGQVLMLQISCRYPSRLSFRFPIFTPGISDLVRLW